MPAGVGVFFLQEERHDAQHHVAKAVHKGENRHQHTEAGTCGGAADGEQHDKAENDGGYAELVFPADDLREQLAVGRGLNLGAGEHDDRHHGGQHAADGAAYDEEGQQRRAEEAGAHVRQGGERAGGHGAQCHHGHENIDHGHQRGGQDQRQRNVAAGVFHIVRDLRHGGAAGQGRGQDGDRRAERGELQAGGKDLAQRQLAGIHVGQADEDIQRHGHQQRDDHNVVHGGKGVVSEIRDARVDDQYGDADGYTVSRQRGEQGDEVIGKQHREHGYQHGLKQVLRRHVHSDDGVNELGGRHKKAAGGGNDRGDINVGDHLCQRIDGGKYQRHNNTGTDVVDNGGQRAEDAGADDSADAGCDTADQAQLFGAFFHVFTPLSFFSGRRDPVSRGRTSRGS